MLPLLFGCATVSVAGLVAHLTLTRRSLRPAVLPVALLAWAASDAIVSWP